MYIIFELGGKEVYRLEQLAVGHPLEIPTLGDSIQVPEQGVFRVRGRKFHLFKNHIAAIYIFIG